MPAPATGTGPSAPVDRSPEHAAFRSRVRAWLAEHAAAALREGGWRGVDHDALVEAARAWQRTLFDNGLAGISWPAEYGGGGRDIAYSVILSEEMRAYDLPVMPLLNAIWMGGPLIAAIGTPEQKARHLEAILSGRELWCLLLSEPGAGSDLAGLSTRARRDGDTFVINGQKVWTTFGHKSDFALLLARTDPDVAKHKGLTMFVLDMRSAGVTVRQITKMTGEPEFCEVFLDDVRIPADSVVGAIGGGWAATGKVLTCEREMLGSGAAWNRDVSFATLQALVDDHGLSGRADAVTALADCYVRERILDFLQFRTRMKLLDGAPPGAEMSVLKLQSVRHQVETIDAAMQLLGSEAVLAGHDAYREGSWQYRYLHKWSLKFGGGTEQIQKNIIAERLLGLPREPQWA